MKIALIGYGWLAKKFARHIEEKKIPETELILTRRNAFSLSKEDQLTLNYQTVELDLENHQTATSYLSNVEFAFCFITPSENYPQHIRNLIGLLDPKAKLVLISSTGVFSNTGFLDERSEVISTTPRSQRILRGETEALKRENTQIIRSGGQIGPDRLPAQSISKRANDTIQDAPVNIIHSEDLVEIMSLVLESKIESQVIHAVSPHHPMKSEYYSLQAKKLGLSLPSFKPMTDSKTVDSIILKEVNYQWLNPTCD